MMHFLFNVCCVGFEPLGQDGSQPAKGRRQYAGQPAVDSRRWSAAKSIPRNQDLIKNIPCGCFLFIHIHKTLWGGADSEI